MRTKFPIFCNLGLAQILSVFLAVSSSQLFFIAFSLGAPSLNWVDNLGSATLQIIPSGIGSVEAEIAIVSSNPISAAILSDAVTFNTPTAGANPFINTLTTGLYTDELDSGHLFASFESIVLESDEPIDFLTIHYLSGNFYCDGYFLNVVSSLVKEGEVNYTPAVSFSTIFDCFFLLGDANNDGIINTNDVFPFVLALTDREEYTAAFPGVIMPNQLDQNYDGLVNTNDIEPFITIHTGPGSSNASQVAIPEPTSFLQAFIVLLCSFASPCFYRIRRIG